MSSDFAFHTRLRMAELFDGRLVKYGIVEKIDSESTSETLRLLVDNAGTYVWVYADDEGCAMSLCCYGVQSALGIARMLTKISECYGRSIYSVDRCVDRLLSGAHDVGGTLPARMCEDEIASIVETQNSAVMAVRALFGDQADPPTDPLGKAPYALYPRYDASRRFDDRQGSEEVDAPAETRH